VFSIFIGSQKELLRSKITLFFILAFPSLLIFILGTMLANLDNPDEVVEPFELAYIINSDDPTTVQTAESIIEQFEDVEQVNFSKSTDLAFAKQRLEEDQLGAVVVFTEPFGIEIHEGYDDVRNRAVRSIFDSVARLYGVVGVVMSETSAGDPASVADAARVVDPAGVVDPAPAVDPASVADPAGAAAALVNPSDFSALVAKQPRVEEKIYGVSRTMIDYYAITMIVMMFFMGSAIGGASAFYLQRRDGTLRRILASPQSRVSIYLQMMLQSVPQNLIQVLSAMLLSVFLFDAHYALTWQLNLLLFVMLFFAGLAVSSFFLALGILIRFNPMLVLIPVMWVVLFVSGSFSKEIFIPGVTTVMPAYLIQTAAFDLTLFGGVHSSITVVMVSLAVIVVSTLFGCALISRRDVAS
jgi:ABC-2 type transport system permease protein